MSFIFLNRRVRGLWMSRRDFKKNSHQLSEIESESDLKGKSHVKTFGEISPRVNANYSLISSGGARSQFQRIEISEDLKKKLSKIKMLIMDVDGILTDCRIFLEGEDQWRRQFSIRDGYGISRLIDSGYQTGIITGSKAIDIEKRVNVLKIPHFYQGSLDKIPAFEKILEVTGLVPDEVAYMGDDLFDMPVLKKVGFAATVSDAMEDVIEIVDYIAQRPAGNGAVREVCDLIFSWGALRKGSV